MRAKEYVEDSGGKEWEFGEVSQEGETSPRFQVTGQPQLEWSGWLIQGQADGDGEDVQQDGVTKNRERYIKHVLEVWWKKSALKP